MIDDPPALEDEKLLEAMGGKHLLIGKMYYPPDTSRVSLSPFTFNKPPSRLEPN